MKLTKLILILIAGLAIMGFSTTGFAWVETGTPDVYMEEVFEAAEEEELLAEPEFEAGLMGESEYFLEELESERESMEEDEYLVDEETVKPTVIPVKEEAWDEHFIPEVY
jgi:hypothetical protein